MPKLKDLFSIIVLLSVQFICQAQDSIIKTSRFKRCSIKTINFEQGLLNNETSSLLTDRSGYTWVSTKTGMQRYNGYVFENINPVVGNDTILIDYCVIFFQLKNGNIWISYQQGILEYDPVNNIFRNIIKVPNQRKGYLPVIPVLQKQDDIWCMFAKKGIVIYKENNKVSEPFANVEVSFVDSILEIAPFLFTRNATSNGTDIFLANSKRIFQFNTNTMKAGYLQNDFINNISCIECNKNKLFVASEKGFSSIDIYDPGITKNIPYKTLTTESLFSAQVCLAGENQLLLCINRHLYEFDTSCNYKKEFTSLAGEPVLATGQIHLMYTDRFRRIWLMTNDDIKLIQNVEIPFSHYIYHNAKTNFVKSIYYDEQNHLLLAGCYNGGIQLYDTSGNPLWEKPLVTDIVKDVMTIEKLTEDNYLIETYYRGWFMLNVPSKKIIPFSLPGPIEKIIQTNTVAWTNNIQRMNDSIILIATRNNVYHCVFKNTALLSAKPLLPFLSNSKDQFDCFVYTANKTLWAGTSVGSVYIMDKNGNQKIINSPGNFGTRSILEDAMHNVWIGTDKGLYVYDVQGKLIKKIYRESGLLNDCIYALLPIDGKPAVFASTNYGLSYISIDGTIKNYTKELGLQENEFNNGAAIKTKAGRFYFGGVNGITGFYPGSLTNVKDTPILNITKLVVNDSNYTASAGIWNNDSILLKYSQNHIQLDIAANGLLNSDEYTYTYRLKGLEDSWQTTRQPTAIRYTLDPGSYTFEINCSPYLSSNIVFSKKVLIIVYPPWWRTWWFRLLSVVCLAFLIAFIVWQYNRRDYLKKIRALQVQQQIQQERERISRDLHDNLGAYVAAIVANVNRIREPDPTVASRAINELENNSQSIVTQLHDTIWALNREAIALTAISDRFKVFLQKIRPTYPGIDISVKESILIDSTLSPANALHLFRIMQEAVNNAVRHSHCHNLIVSIESNSNWTINIIDDGTGMSKDKDPNAGNGLRNMQQRAKEAGWNIQWMQENPNGTRLEIKSMKDKVRSL
ncbi:MAG: ATP-binding protein [Ferruginibacter sp.]